MMLRIYGGFSTIYLTILQTVCNAKLSHPGIYQPKRRNA